MEGTRKLIVGMEIVPDRFNLRGMGGGSTYIDGIDIKRFQYMASIGFRSEFSVEKN